VTIRYDESYFESPIEKGLDSLNDARDLPILLRLLNPQPNEKILDVGCGLGRFDGIIAHTGAEVTGFDISEYAIEKAREKYNGNKQLRFICTNALDMNYKSQFDKVICYHMIEHLTQTESRTLLAKINDALKDEGTLVIGLPINDFTFTRRILRFIARHPQGRVSFSLKKIKLEITSAGLSVTNVYPLSYRDMRVPEGISRIPFLRQGIFSADIRAIKK
jgi:2-polyprenyl-3-methyl-5-hydroxy-6-metoxy-1,4-benzoquinol methylase